MSGKATNGKKKRKKQKLVQYRRIIQSLWSTNFTSDMFIVDLSSSESSKTTVKGCLLLPLQSVFALE